LVKKYIAEFNKNDKKTFESHLFEVITYIVDHLAHDYQTVDNIPYPLIYYTL